MKKPILSICIPTFNRAGYLHDCLESIALQVCKDESFNSQIEVVVSDNASTDETKSVVDEYKNRFTNFTYTRNEENLGFDLNILNVVRSASGEYIWYLGDDDLIVNGSLKFVTGLLETREYDVGGVASEHLVSSKQSYELHGYTNNDVVTEIDSNDYYFNGYCEGAVSALIFKRSLWLDELDEKNFLEFWLYYEVVLRILVNSKKKKFYVTKPAIITGQDCRWAENGDELFTYTNSNILLQHMLTWGFDEQRITASINENAKKLPLIVLRAKGHGLSYHPKNLAYIWKHMRHAGTTYLVIATLIFFVPNTLVRLIRDSRKNLRNQNE
ncbi:hypothetical protein CL644_01745 [bacterium]|nr:hypothetical protein [bacterium]|tara:strand:- start:6133 stop:7113 length:981 start_codon:yes stop_codon:yes gene_type:complete